MSEPRKIEANIEMVMTFDGYKRIELPDLDAPLFAGGYKSKTDRFLGCRITRLYYGDFGGRFVICVSKSSEERKHIIPGYYQISKDEVVVDFLKDLPKAILMEVFPIEQL